MRTLTLSDRDYFWPPADELIEVGGSLRSRRR